MPKLLFLLIIGFQGPHSLAFSESAEVNEVFVPVCLEGATSYSPAELDARIMEKAVYHMLSHYVGDGITPNEVYLQIGETDTFDYSLSFYAKAMEKPRKADQANDDLEAISDCAPEDQYGVLLAFRNSTDVVISAVCEFGEGWFVASVDGHEESLVIADPPRYQEQKTFRRKTTLTFCDAGQSSSTEIVLRQKTTSVTTNGDTYNIEDPDSQESPIIKQTVNHQDTDVDRPENLADFLNNLFE
jgi:hypothetical protein